LVPFLERRIDLEPKDYYPAHEHMTQEEFDLIRESNRLKRSEEVREYLYWWIMVALLIFGLMTRF
jgi:hypothetical protein